MKCTLLLLIVVSFFSCKRDAYVTHKVKLEKTETACGARQDYFRMNSNFGGERYEFEKCLSANFSDKQISSEHHGDTVIVKFNSSQAQGDVVYKVTLDIDGYPVYKFLTIDADTYTITPAEK